MRLRHLLALAATAAALTACTTSQTTPEQTTTTIDTGLAAHTRDTFQVTWTLTPEADRDVYCDSVTLLGPQGAADQMAAGADYSTELDWTLMAELLQDECALR